MSAVSSLTAHDPDSLQHHQLTKGPRRVATAFLAHYAAQLIKAEMLYVDGGYHTAFELPGRTRAKRDLTLVDCRRAE